VNRYVLLNCEYILRHPVQIIHWTLNSLKYMAFLKWNNKKKIIIIMHITIHTPTRSDRKHFKHLHVTYICLQLKRIQNTSWSMQKGKTKCYEQIIVQFLMLYHIQAYTINMDTKTICSTEFMTFSLKKLKHNLHSNVTQQTTFSTEYSLCKIELNKCDA
jgi:hypothetical protein